MRLLHINSYFSTSGLFSQLYDRQVEMGHQIQVYVPISHQYPQEKIAAKGSYTTISRCFNQIERYVFPIKHNKIWKDLEMNYHFGDLDLVHAHSLFSNGWLARQIYLKHNIPYIVAIRNADVRTFFERAPWLRKIGLDVMRDAQRIIFISQNAYNEVYNKYVPPKEYASLNEKTQVIANGIEDFWHENQYTKKITEIHQPLRFVSAGKLTSGKRFVELAEMLEEYARIYGPVELHIAGPSWDPKVEAQLEKYSHVHYHGPLSKEEMRNLYRKMDIFILLSYPETFGLVYPEAMSQALPVIYTRGEGFDSFFKNYQVGVSVDRFNQIALNEAIQYICKYYPQISKNASQGISYFKWDRIVKEYEKIYQTVS
ncbi:glycosyltransferase family 4 protein [Facklamia sp. DSM 111018]|uniref:Glycosyltransferase family 4 protein n=1 Tax=Facklamia lactis TaxID=2749967 RepID=A0ABS0LRK5_9LACT|nr:glycosyltransferase family 4 protein [Facklamia lactis]MBG9980842.1 glycosyltransferase family 4 protein [Facklamia lactis]MBG9986795.1 glycosyltransferase family 4 protein [Facklamia lactis]